MDIPIPPDFSNNILQEGRPVIKNGVITSTDILSANSFEDKVAIACTLSQPIVSQAELQAWKLYVIDLKQARCNKLYYILIYIDLYNYCLRFRDNMFIIFVNMYVHAFSFN